MKMVESKEKKSEKSESKPLIAKRDFVIKHNDYLRRIKAGDDLSDVPALYHANLKTEKVL